MLPEKSAAGALRAIHIYKKRKSLTILLLKKSAEEAHNDQRLKDQYAWIL